MFPAFADVPAYPLVFVVFWGAVAFFALAMARHLRIFAAARAEGPSPLDDVPARLGGLIRYAFVQTKMFKDPRAALMHWGIFWGFVLLTVGTANVVTGGLVQAIVSAPFDGLLWAAVLAMQNIVALVTIGAVLWAFERRLIEKPARLELNVLAVPLRSLPAGVLEVGFAVMWWTHMAVVSAFLLYLPGSKHLHIVTSFFNIYFRKLKPRGELPAMDLEREDATFGVRTLADLGWRDLLDGFTCTECGRCREQCPAWNTGKPLDPKHFIMGLREMSVEAEQGLPLIPNSAIVRDAYGLDDSVKPERLMKPIVDAAIPYDAVWDCVTCGACVEACPVLIEHVDKIVDLRRNLVLEDSRFPQELSGAFRNMEGVANPWGQPPSTRTDWTKGLPFAVPTVAELAAEDRLGEIDVLYWVGCAAAFDDRNRKVARAFATCLDAAGVRFAILGQEESCTGDPARRMGNDYVYQMLATGNIETLNRYRMGERTIVTACPHCFNSIGNEYGQLGGHFRVMHHSAYLRELISTGRLRVLDDGPARSVTLHDSCYLTRYNGVIQEPRDVLASVPGLELREMDNHGRQTFCCGAGGGRMWMEETRGTRINESRTAQALATGAEAVATECPYCMTMLKDGLEAADANLGGAVKAIDISELLADSLAPVQPGSRALPVLQ
ncbi:MAG: (Fe-S)-binding protein [Chloroflexi bacterium]|nr:(Fe-S)-binding protein [Chloroflexota bacterium]